MLLATLTHAIAIAQRLVRAGDHRGSAGRLLSSFVIWTALQAGASVAHAAAHEDRPNLILIVADDLRAETLGCMGNRVVATPHIDRLASRGAHFRNAFVTTSICAVSRASIFSGQYARRHAIDDFKKRFTKEAWSNTYPAQLRAAGYRTGFIGKFGVGDVMPVEAFDYWDGFPGQGEYLPRTNKVHLTRRMGDSALRFIETADRKPYCLSISFKAPHAQDGARREFPPDAEDETLYSDRQLPKTANLDPAAHARLPEFVRNSEGHTRFLRRFATDAMREATVKDYYRLVTGIDREVGRLIEALERSGQARNTIIVFTSDNGFFLGERGLSDKFLMYEESIRVPLIIADLRDTGRKQGKVVYRMALNIDLAPTLLDYAKIPRSAAIQGDSLRPLVEGRRVKWREDWFYEHHFTYGGKIPASEGVRTDRWKYIRYLEAQPVVEELYDLRSDPAEQRNLASESRQARRLQALRNRWTDLRDVLQ